MYHEFALQLPQGQEEGILLISELAQKSNLDVKAVKSRSKETFKDQDDKAIVIDGKTCQVVSISLYLSGTYSQFNQYAQDLSDMNNGMVTIEQLSITKQSEEDKSLIITLELNLYLMS